MIHNYLSSQSLQSSPVSGQQKQHLSIAQRLQNTFGSSRKGNAVRQESLITQYDRSYAIQKLFDLHAKKDYKQETLFTAQAIMDRYLYIIGYNTFPREQMCRLATISMLMAAKLEQPISPSFTRMISLLSEDEKRFVTKQSLIEMEAEILRKLGFDFNFPGPIQSLERYLRILDYDTSKTVQEMSF